MANLQTHIDLYVNRNTLMILHYTYFDDNIRTVDFEQTMGRIFSLEAHKSFRSSQFLYIVIVPGL